MTAAERRGMRLGFLQDVVADWWEVAVDFQFEDVKFFEKNVNTQEKLTVALWRIPRRLS